MVNEIRKQKIVFSLLKAGTFFVVAILLFVLLYTITKGIRVVNFKFLTSMWQHQDISQGGIFPAIYGTLFLALGTALVSIPVGVCTAIYLNEYASDNYLTKSINMSVRNLAGVPSIVYGLFGLAFFVFLLNMGTSLIAASFTLGAMTLPWIITSSQEALKSVPHSFREGSYALGATKWQTIRKNVLPHSMSGILTGSVLGVSRAIGETAPIILVGATFYISYLPKSPFDKFMALPYHMFILATQHSSPLAKSYALGTALVLISLVFTLNLGVFIYRYKLRKNKDW